MNPSNCGVLDVIFLDLYHIVTIRLMQRVRFIFMDDVANISESNTDS